MGNRHRLGGRLGRFATVGALGAVLMAGAAGLASPAGAATPAVAPSATNPVKAIDGVISELNALEAEWIGNLNYAIQNAECAVLMPSICAPLNLVPTIPIPSL